MAEQRRYSVKKSESYDCDASDREFQNSEHCVFTINEDITLKS
ncbi:7726_t:CDS:2 [Ambispora gerdemannii]|uniref:7726_t:CDS:1 n=1 Tax=Ambispora gerdemannii TaxID=144530 RepID=A0A9N9BV56_9GLOM|nr:7726_t:CDS:2 [Ambispora gerdemannii]